ncbi:MAG: hypothetical protein FWE67_04190 [Planctomycetaceae bacterium]|nr:hypothetical protein [Planctomycetaceae bacterium]
MHRFYPYFCVIVLCVYLSVPSLNAQSKPPASGGKTTPAAKPADAKVNVAAPNPDAAKPLSDDKTLAKYKAWNIDADLEKTYGGNKEPAKFRTETAKMLADNAKRDAFFDTYYFARWTNPDTQGLVQTYLDDFIKKDLDPLTGSTREYLLKKSFEILQKMAADAAATPTARYNAVLAIGLLSQAKAKDNNSAPTAYAPALPYLIEQYNKGNNPQYIQLGALLGIVRHCAMGIADANLNTAAVPNLLVKIITDGKPAAGNEDKNAQYLIDCFRTRAIDGLALLGSGNAAPGNIVKGIKTFYDILENNGEAVEMRTRAARALGELNYKALGETATPVPYDDIITTLLDFTKQLSDSEIQIISDMLAKTKAETGGVSALGGEGGMRTGPAGQAVDTGPPFDSLPVEKKLEVINVFQRVKSEFEDIMYGIRGGVKGSASTAKGMMSAIPTDSPMVKKINSTQAAMRNLFTYLDEKDERQKKLDDRKKAAAGPQMEGGGEGMVMGEGIGRTSGGPNAEADKNMDIKPLKVNLGDIKFALETFSAELLDKVLKSG